MEIRDLVKHPDPKIREVWIRGRLNEFGRLLKGIGMKRERKSRVIGHDTMHFIKKSQAPKNKKVAYILWCADRREQKEEVERVRGTVGGNVLDYYGETSTEVAALETVKIHLNSVISTKGAKYACVDVRNFYTNSRLDEPEFMRIHIDDFTEEVIKEYNVMEYLDEDGYVYCQIDGCMYGLSQAGKIANDDLKKILEPHGYYPSKRTSGLWFHKKRPISFTLVVDDFGIKFENKEDIDHLLKIIEDNNYPIKTGWDGSKYLGIDLEWDYVKRTVLLSMKGYAKKDLKQFGQKLRRKTYAPLKYTQPEYGKYIQYADTDTSPLLTDEEKKKIKKLAGKFLYTSRAVDNTMAHILNEISI